MLIRSLKCLHERGFRFLVPLLATVTLAASPHDDPPGGTTEDAVGRLIVQLGSDDPTTREAATCRLLDLEAADAALRRALSSSDAEVKRRARRILDAFADRRLFRFRERLRVNARALQPDLLAEQLLTWRGAGGDEACWQALLDLGWHLIRHERTAYSRATLSDLPPRRSAR
ncbi:MAG: hypothetical protein ACRC33_02195 [Gemmataceae bacterium]